MAMGAPANPPPSTSTAKGFRRKGGSKKRKGASSPATPAADVVESDATSSLQDVSPSIPPAPFSISTSSSPPSSSSGSGTLDSYFKTLKKVKLLKPDEEVVLGRRIQRGEHSRNLAAVVN